MDLNSFFKNFLTLRHFMQGFDLNEGDYDGRTALHVAAAEGHLQTARWRIHDVNKCRS